LIHCTDTDIEAVDQIGSWTPTFWPLWLWPPK
jgi:hypothetical protein